MSVLAGGAAAVPAALASRGSRRIGGVDVAAITGAEAMAAIDSGLRDGVFTRVAFLNAHCVNLAHADADYRACLGDFLVLPDGVGVDIASKLLYGGPFPDNLNGTDFVPALLLHLRRPLRVGLLGAAPGITERAAQRFCDLAPHHAFVAIGDGFFGEGAGLAAVTARLRAEKVDILLVGLGVPRQELFIAQHLSAREAGVAIAVGALLDFAAGNVPRAPGIVRSLRLEWLFRLLIEPRRLWKRYLVGNPLFLSRIVAARLGAGRRRS